MSKKSCPCPDTAYEPDSPCCPDTIEIADAIDVRDRSCKMRRLKPDRRKGTLVVTQNNKAMFGDGSEDQPQYMAYEEVITADGYVIVQTKAGRVLALKPDADQTALYDVLNLVYRDGVLKFAPPESEAQIFDDEDIVTVNKGILATFACAGDGKVRLAKLLPDCITEPGAKRYLTINEDGEIECDDHDVGDCPTVEDVDTLDSIWGCKAGVFSPILPIVGKHLVGRNDPAEWVLEDVTTGIKFVLPYHFVGQLHAGPARTPSIAGLVDLPSATSGLTSGSFDMTTVAGYVAGATVAYVRAVCIVDVISGGEAKAQVSLNGTVAMEAYIDTGGAFGFGYINTGPWIPVALTGDAFTFALTATSSGTPVANAKLQIAGWER